MSFVSCTATWTLTVTCNGGGSHASSTLKNGAVTPQRGDFGQKHSGIRPENIFVSLLEVPKENRSFSTGIAQYA